MKPLRLIAFSIILFIAYNNCSKNGFHSISSSTPSTPDGPGSDDSSGGDDDINTLKNPKPAVLCGESGYRYMMDEYVYDNCVGCHAQGGLVEPALADRDISISYPAALTVSKEEFLKASSKNTICGGCNLNPQGEVYKALEEWLDHRFQSCDE